MPPAFRWTSTSSSEGYSVGYMVHLLFLFMFMWYCDTLEYTRIGPYLSISLGDPGLGKSSEVDRQPRALVNPFSSNCA